MATAGLGDSGFRNGSVVDRRSVAPNAILQSQVHVMCSLKCLCEMFKSYYVFQTYISSAKVAGGSPGNVSNLYFRFANLYLEFLGIIYLPICMF